MKKNTYTIYFTRTNKPIMDVCTNRPQYVMECTETEAQFQADRLTRMYGTQCHAVTTASNTNQTYRADRRADLDWIRNIIEIS